MPSYRNAASSKDNPDRLSSVDDLLSNELSTSALLTDIKSWLSLSSIDNTNHNQTIKKLTVSSIASQSGIAEDTVKERLTHCIESILKENYNHSLTAPSKRLFNTIFIDDKNAIEWYLIDSFRGNEQKKRFEQVISINISKKLIINAVKSAVSKMPDKSFLLTLELPLSLQNTYKDVLASLDLSIDTSDNKKIDLAFDILMKQAKRDALLKLAHLLPTPPINLKQKSVGFSEKNTVEQLKALIKSLDVSSNLKSVMGISRFDTPGGQRTVKFKIRIIRPEYDNFCKKLYSFCHKIDTSFDKKDENQAIFEIKQNTAEELKLVLLTLTKTTNPHLLTELGQLLPKPPEKPQQKTIYLTDKAEIDRLKSLLINDLKIKKWSGINEFRQGKIHPEIRVFRPEYDVFYESFSHIIKANGTLVEEKAILASNLNAIDKDLLKVLTSLSRREEKNKLLEFINLLPRPPKNQAQGSVTLASADANERFRTLYNEELALKMWSGIRHFRATKDKDKTYYQIIISRPAYDNFYAALISFGFSEKVKLEPIQQPLIESQMPRLRSSNHSVVNSVTSNDIREQSAKIDSQYFHKTSITFFAPLPSPKRKADNQLNALEVEKNTPLAKSRKLER